MLSVLSCAGWYVKHRRSVSTSAVLTNYYEPIKPNTNKGKHTEAHKQISASAHTSTQTNGQKLAVMMPVFVPLCEPLHSAEADVLTSRGSGREQEKEWIKLKKEQLMTKRLRRTHIKRRYTHTHIYSHTFPFKLTMLYITFQFFAITQPLIEPFLHLSVT